MAEYRYYLIPDFMSHVFPQQFEEQAPTEFFSNTADLMKRYKQLREMPYNNEYTWNERTNLPYPRLTVGIDRRDPDGAVTIMQVRSGVNYLCDDYRGPFADRNDKQLIEMAKQLVTAVGADRIRPHYYTEENGHTKVHVGNDIHITEWANAPELCSALRFSRFLNRDGQQLFQVHNGQRIIENYADGSQLVKDVQTVEELGVDSLMVDEAHYFKNAMVTTKMTRVAGISQTESQKASDMYMKCMYMDELTGGHGIVFATGTPISNSMTEMYIMMRYLQYGLLEQEGPL